MPICMFSQSVPWQIMAIVEGSVLEHNVGSLMEGARLLLQSAIKRWHTHSFNFPATAKMRISQCQVVNDAFV